MSNKLVSFNPMSIEISKEYQNFKKNNTNYDLIRKGLGLIGDFDDRTYLYIHDKMDLDRGKILVFGCFDKDDNNILFYGRTPVKNDKLKINKRKYNYELRYNLRFAEGNEITKDNIELTRSDYILDTKYGRLATDRYSFYNLFVGKDKVYRIEGDFHGDIALPLVKGVNDTNEDKGVINMNVYANIFGKLLGENNLEFTEITLSGYVDFQKKNEVKIKR